MALMITDTYGGNQQRMRWAAVRRPRLHARAVFVREQEGLWHS